MTWLRVGGSSAFGSTEKRCVRWTHFELREYDPVIGRWLSPDPMRQHWSGYLAMDNNPVNHIDADGGTDGPVTYKSGECKCSYVDLNGNRITEYSNGFDLSLLRYEAGFDFSYFYDEFNATTANMIKELADPLYAKSFNQLREELGDLFPTLGEGSLITEEEMFAPDYSPSNEQLAAGVVPILFTRKPWKLTPQGSSRIVKHGTFGTFYKSKSDGTWWSVDRAGHGQSAFKVFKETKEGLTWTHDANVFGDYITGKHKGPTGMFIPWKELNSK